MPTRKLKLNFKQGDLLYVEWYDAASNIDDKLNWISMDKALEGVIKAEMRSVGFFCGRAKGYLVIAANTDAVNDPPTVCDVFQIPESFVKSVKKLRI